MEETTDITDLITELIDVFSEEDGGDYSEENRKEYLEGLYKDTKNIQYNDFYLDENLAYIPKEIGLFPNLEILNIRCDPLSTPLKTQLKGKIPKEIGNLTNLRYLNIRFNLITGHIPTEIGNLTNLEYLNLANNKITGHIPTEIGNLRKLQELYLVNNEMTGEIPIDSIKHIKNIQLDNNNFDLTNLTGLKLKELRKYGFKLNQFNTFNANNVNKYGLNKIFNLDNLDTIDTIEKIIIAYIFSGGFDELLNNKQKLQIKYGLTEKEVNEKIDIIKNMIRNKQRMIYPQIYDVFRNHPDKIYYQWAHGMIIPNQYFFVPHNVSIILVTTPAYVAVGKINRNTNRREYLRPTLPVNENYLDVLLPGISYGRSLEKKNQLRFFRSGDIINNVNLDFRMVFGNRHSLFQGGIFKYLDVKNKKDRGVVQHSFALLNWHIKNGNISWPEITRNNFKSTLHDIVSKFIGKKGHYVLIAGSCQEGDISDVKNKSLIYNQYELIKQKLSCFQVLANLIEQNTQNNIKRLQNFSSTHKKANCYQELMSKIRKKINNIKNNSNNKRGLQEIYNYWKTAYNNIDLFTVEDLVSVIEKLDDITPGEMEHYYNVNEYGISAENKRQQRYKNELTINNVSANALALMRGGNNYIKVKNYGIRKIRYYKNGKKYIIINGKKKKILHL